MLPLKGQKLTDNPKNIPLQLRLDKETADKLEFLANKRNVPKSRVVRDGIILQYERETEK